MSWEGWAQSCLRYKNNPACSEAWIVGNDGNVWGYAHNPDAGESGPFPQIKQFLSPAEAAKVVKITKDGPTQEDTTSGLYIDGERYAYMQGDPGDHVLYKKGTKGILFAVAATCMVAGVYTDGIVGANNMMQVLSIRDQLKNAGY